MYSVINLYGILRKRHTFEMSLKTKICFIILSFFKRKHRVVSSSQVSWTNWIQYFKKFFSQSLNKNKKKIIKSSLCKIKTFVKKQLQYIYLQAILNAALFLQNSKNC